MDEQALAFRYLQQQLGLIYMNRENLVQAVYLYTWAQIKLDVESALFK